MKRLEYYSLIWELEDNAPASLGETLTNLAIGGWSLETIRRIHENPFELLVICKREVKDDKD